MRLGRDRRGKRGGEERKREWKNKTKCEKSVAGAKAQSVRRACVCVHVCVFLVRPSTWIFGSYLPK